MRALRDVHTQVKKCLEHTLSKNIPYCGDITANLNYLLVMLPHSVFLIQCRWHGDLHFLVCSIQNDDFWTYKMMAFGLKDQL
jgi:hypothetical protein